MMFNNNVQPNNVC